MDTSDKYVEMCKQAHEVQGKRVPIWSFCNFFYIRDPFDKDGKQYLYTPTIVGSPRTENTVWLPRQDQLQQLCYDHERMARYHPDHRFEELLGIFESWYNEREVLADSDTVAVCEAYMNSSSFEQLWLRFVMWYLYDKKWLVNEKIWE